MKIYQEALCWVAIKVVIALLVVISNVYSFMVVY